MTANLFLATPSTTTTKKKKKRKQKTQQINSVHHPVQTDGPSGLAEDRSGTTPVWQGAGSSYAVRPWVKLFLVAGGCRGGRGGLIIWWWPPAAGGIWSTSAWWLETLGHTAACSLLLLTVGWAQSTRSFSEGNDYYNLLLLFNYCSALTCFA